MRNARILITAAALVLAPGAIAGSSPFGKKPEFLPVDQAFELQPLVQKADGTLEVSWRIAREYYLYRDRLSFTALAPATLKLGKPLLPASLPHEDEHFGVTEIYRDRVVVQLPAGKGLKDVRLSVTYQGCADAGLCYPPQTRTLGTDD